MFGNYLKITLRNISKHKGFSFINVSGLALGMTICILIMLWVYDEWSYDRFHDNADDLYRIIKIWRKGEVSHQAVTPAPLAPALKEEFPEIVDTARVYPTGKWLLRYNDKAFYETYGLFTDPSIFTMFTIPLLKGNRATALSLPRSMVLTETMATKYFGSENPIGKTIRMDNRYDFSITGVMKDIPRNSHLQFDFVVPFSLVGREGLMERLAQKTLIDWHNTSFYSYVLLKRNTPYKEFSRKISTYLKKPIRDDTSLLYLQPLKEIHLYSSRLRANVPGTGDITNIYLLLAMAFIILLMACINFMNLTTARGTDRSKEVGIRKVVGARRTGIIKQFFSESFLLAFFALILATILVELLLPAFSRLTGKQLMPTWPGNPFILPGMIIVTLLTGIMAGSYPAFFLSSFQPAKVLKNALKPGTRSGLFRKALVIFQFSLAVIFLVGSMVIYRQLDYIKNKPLGFEKENLLKLEIPDALEQCPFQYYFADEPLDGMYIAEKRVMIIFIYLSLLAICIACHGIYGLSVFLAEQRTREIGIRKVFGASWADVWRLFLCEFMKWIITANLLAWPIAYLLLDTLLMRNFTYRINIGIWPFVMSGILTSVIALLTVGFQTFKAAAANPSDALRCE